MGKRVKDLDLKAMNKVEKDRIAIVKEAGKIATAWGAYKIAGSIVDKIPNNYTGGIKGNAINVAKRMLKVGIVNTVVEMYDIHANMGILICDRVLDAHYGSKNNVQVIESEPETVETPEE